MRNRDRHRARQFDEATTRSEEQIQLIDQVVLNDVVTTVTSHPVPCAAFRHFALYLRVKSAGTPTTVQFIVQFANEPQGPWHKYAVGPFVSLYYEDEDTATEQAELFVGDVAGRSIRLHVIGLVTSDVNTFTVSAVLGLWC